MNEEREQARREVLDWFQGRGSTVVLVLLAAFVLMFVLVGAGVL
jgi:succinate dehydrogenase hydrophobic anchor subunit